MTFFLNIHKPVFISFCNTLDMCHYQIQILNNSSNKTNNHNTVRMNIYNDIKRVLY